MDETGFRISYRKAQLVVIIDLNKPLHMIDPGNCNYITLVEYVGSADKTIPSMYVTNIWS